MRTINKAGLLIIKVFEGCKLEAYPDPGTGDVPWTIGYGHTGKEVCPGFKITQEQADTYLKNDLIKFCMFVDNCTDHKLNDNQFSACVALAYNIGLGNFLTSTLRKLITMNKYADAANQFLAWNHAAGKVMLGLTRRRQAEANLFKVQELK